MLEPTAS